MTLLDLVRCTIVSVPISNSGNHATSHLPTMNGQVRRSDASPLNHLTPYLDEPSSLQHSPQACLLSQQSAPHYLALPTKQSYIPAEGIWSSMRQQYWAYRKPIHHTWYQPFLIHSRRIKNILYNGFLCWGWSRLVLLFLAALNEFQSFLTGDLEVTYWHPHTYYYCGWVVLATRHLCTRKQPNWALQLKGRV